MKPTFTYLSAPAIEPQPGCMWADTMVLNPAIMKDPESDTLHMLFRATGPWPHKKAFEGCRDPYPIFLGYARSNDMGRTWEADFSRPALEPSLEYDKDKIYIKDDQGNMVMNYTNGCLEDPRIFQIEGQYYITIAGRMFPPGPYWNLYPEGVENVPAWVGREDDPTGLKKKIQNTTSSLYKLDLKSLAKSDYDNAFSYVCNLTDPRVDDNRDVFFFPEKMRINNKLMYVMLHRPHNPSNFEAGKGHTKPSIMLAAAENMRDFATDKAIHLFLAEGMFDWEEERIGASWPPIRISSNEWLLQYHGKTMPGYGYTQSFMILREKENNFPEILHRCPERLMYAQQDWELPDKFLCPCLFTTGGIVVEDTLILSYGAADQKVGVAWTSLAEVVEFVRKFDENGRQFLEKQF